MKKILFLSLLLIISLPLFSQTAQQKYLKGNISDKITVIREATDSERFWLSTNAIEFVKNSYNYLQDDRDFENLAVTSIYALPDFSGVKISAESIQEIERNLNIIFLNFKSSNVKCAIISKFLALKNYFNTNNFAVNLMGELIQNEPILIDSTLLQSIISALGEIGDNTSFILLFNYYNNNTIPKYSAELKNSLIKLIPQSMDEIIRMIHTKNYNNINSVYTLIKENSEISQNNLSEIAENLLNEAILLMSNSTDKTKELVQMQLGALKILNDNKCTRASSSVISYFELAKKEHKDGIISDAEFVGVVNSLGNLAPIGAVSPLVTYLEETNNAVENEKMVSTEVVTALIKTLGAIGDKSAFDALLAVTYLNYPDSVLIAARNALSGLKW
ncbi:MAG: hypothetical protein MJ179_01765 [Treponema sp.]|nr:hypothetical protein [Treponema sp.]